MAVGTPVFEQAFLKILYAPWERDGVIEPPPAAQLRGGNALLEAAAQLCEATSASRGLYAVVTTNYDCLMEKALAAGPAKERFLPAWSSSNFPEGEGRPGSEKKGIFHVHGVPATAGASTNHERRISNIRRNHKLTEAHYPCGCERNLYSWRQCFV